MDMTSQATLVTRSGGGGKGRAAQPPPVYEFYPQDAPFLLVKRRGLTGPPTGDGRAPGPINLTLSRPNAKRYLRSPARRQDTWGGPAGTGRTRAVYGGVSSFQSDWWLQVQVYYKYINPFILFPRLASRDNKIKTLPGTTVLRYFLLSTQLLVSVLLHMW